LVVAADLRQAHARSLDGVVVFFRRVAYDVEATAGKLRAAGLDDRLGR
jgi:hypothetical protein